MDGYNDCLFADIFILKQTKLTLNPLFGNRVTMDVGGVGLLRNVKNAISVARKVLHNTKHSLLGGELATKFALEMGFKEESLQTEESKKMWMDWKENRCQPNYWKVNHLQFD